jgi:hypothetical protein
MTSARDIEHILDLWIADGPSGLPDRVLADALFEIDDVEQRSPLGVPWRLTSAPTPVRLLLVAALAAAAVGAALVVGGAVRPRDDVPRPLVQAPVLGPGVMVGSDPAGIWDSWHRSAYGNEAGDYTLTFPAERDVLLAASPSGRQILLGGMSVDWPGTFSLGATDRCPEGALYTFGVSADGRTLTLASPDDSCSDRESMLARGWARRLVDAELAGGERYRVVTYNALIDLTLPESYSATVWTGANPVSWLKLDDGSLSFILVAGVDTLADRCHQGRGLRAPLRTLDDFSEWIAANPGIEASAVTETTVAGHPARMADVAGRPDCDMAYDGMPFTMLSSGIHARDWGVDVGGQVLLFELIDDSPPHDPMTPAMLAIGDALIGSIEISEP